MNKIKEGIYFVWQYVGGCVVCPYFYWLFEERFLV
jgi:hypothetical protein